MPIIYVFFPETKGLELEDVDELFTKGNGDVVTLQTSSIMHPGSEHEEIKPAVDYVDNGKTMA